MVGTNVGRFIINALSNNLIDEEIDVDDARHNLDAAVERLRAAVDRRALTVRELLALAQDPIA